MPECVAAADISRVDEMKDLPLFLHALGDSQISLLDRHGNCGHMDNLFNSPVSQDCPSGVFLFP